MQVRRHLDKPHHALLRLPRLPRGQLGP
jgi:hypothetical protein